MKAKMILVTVASIGLGGLLMAGGPHGNCDNENNGVSQRQLLVAHGGHHGRHSKLHKPHRGNGIIRQVMRELDLTQDQKNQIREIIKSNKKARLSAKKHKKLRRPSIDVSKFMTTDSFDKYAYIKELQRLSAKRIAAKQAQKVKRMERRADRMAKIFEVLTPEQRAKLIQLSSK